MARPTNARISLDKLIDQWVVSDNSTKFKGGTRTMVAFFWRDVNVFRQALNVSNLLTG